MFSLENILKQDSFATYIICFWSSVTTNITKHWNGVEVLYSDHSHHLFFFRPQRTHFFELTASEGQTKDGGETEGSGDFSAKKRLWSLFKYSSPDRHGSMIFVASQTIDQMKRFCATEVIKVSELFHLPIFWVSVLEVTRPCHRLVYPFLSQVNCSGETWSRCFAVLCWGCLLTIPILQKQEEKNSCQILVPRVSLIIAPLSPFIHEVPVELKSTVAFFFCTKLLLQ